MIKKRTLFTLMIILFIISIATSINAYDMTPPNATVHQHITKEAEKVWNNTPKEIKRGDQNRL